MPSDTLSPDVQALILALVVGCIAGFAGGGIVIVLQSVIRSPKRGLG